MVIRTPVFEKSKMNNIKSKKKYVSDHWDLGVAGEGALQKNMLDLHKQSKKNNKVIV